MKNIILYIIFSVLFLTSTANSQTQQKDSSHRPIGIIFSVQGSSFPAFGNFMGGIAIQKYISSKASIRLSAGGYSNETYTSYSITSSYLVDILETSNTSAYVGGGVFYTRDDKKENVFSISVPLGARISVWQNTTLGVEYSIKLDVNPIEINAGTSSTQGQLTFWF